MTPITLYYTLTCPKFIIQSLQAYDNLYYDVECRKLAGYYSVSGTKNTISKNKFMYDISMTLYFNDRIISYNYTKNDNNEINTPIKFDNSWSGNGKTYLGYVTRSILDDKTTRRVTINL